MKSPLSFLCLALLLPGCKKDEQDSAAETCSAPTDQWTLGEVIDTEGCGVLAKIEQAPWGGPLWVLRLEGDHYDMGYQHGRLAGPQLLDLWWTYMGTIGEEIGISAESTDTMLGNMLDTAWEYYEPNTPDIFMEEFQGMAAGMEAAGVEYDDHNDETDDDLISLPIRLITLIDLAMSSQLDFDNLSALSTFLSNGYTEALLEYYGMSARPAPPEVRSAIEALRAAGAHGQVPGLDCSYFAAWGDRTDDGGLYMTRNMDFTSDSGIYEYAMVTAFVPDEGVPYASISWLGASLGVLAGISQQGIAVSAVGAESPYERVTTEPALLRAREALQFSYDLDGSLPSLTNTVDDGINRAPTIGYNALLSWGDPENDGADAQSVILETNGLEVGAFHHHNDCTVEPSLLRFDYDGEATEWTQGDHPEWVNDEADAKEIDGEGNVRLFEVDAHGDYVLDAHGNYIEVEKGGQPIQTGYPEPCALYRGDEAMAYGVRIHQAAAHGPMGGDGSGLMIDSGTYEGRYWPMRQMTVAYAEGSEFTWNDEVVIPDSGGAQVPIGLDEAEAISRVAAMSSNVWDVVYDTTDLVIRVSYESGTGDDWIPASEQPPFLEIDLQELFLTD